MPCQQNKFHLTNFLNRLETYSDKFQSKHEQIMKNKNKQSTDDYFVNDVANTFEDCYYDTKSKLEELLAAFTQADPFDGSTRSVGSEQSQRRYAPFQSNLPPISIEPFSGKQVNWEDFLDLFRSVIYHDEDMPLVTKFYYLRSLFKGKSSELIKVRLEAFQDPCFTVQTFMQFFSESFHPIFLKFSTHIP